MDTRNSEWPPTVRFIDQRLPQMHPMFSNAPVHYDAISHQYALNSQSSGTSSLLSMERPPPRPEWTDFRAMTFWNNMYSSAMEKFKSKTEMRKRHDEYNIHMAADWDGIYSILERARDKHQNKGGKVGWFRRVRRKAADNVAPVQSVAAIVSKVVPDNPYSTPVLGAVGIVLDAAKQTSAVRRQVADVFDGEDFENLIPLFSDVELFLGVMFNDDLHIYKASLELAVAVMKAIDRTVAFYTSRSVTHASKALAFGSDYEKDLVESLKDLNTKSKKLGDEAYKSHMHEAQLYSEYGRKMMSDLREMVLLGFNSVHDVLKEHRKMKDTMEQMNGAMVQMNGTMEQIRANMSYLAIENERARSTSPIPSLWQLPAPQPPAWVSVPVQQPSLTQEQLLMTLGMIMTDADDMEFILTKESEFPPRQRAQAEQIIQQQKFRDWVVPAESARILVQWQDPTPHAYADLTPLSIFCTKLAHALAAHDGFMSIQWFCGRHLRSNANGGMGHAMVRSMIAQLLRGSPGGFDMQTLAQSFDLPSLLASQDVEEMTQLLAWLVRQLPRTMTLFCFVDGVVFCERHEHYETAEPVLLCLLGLTSDPAVQASVKVLFMSAPGPVIVRRAFEEKGLIVNVETLPRLAMAPSNERLVRELGEGLGS